MRKCTEHASVDQVVGRLFNRTVSPLAKDTVDAFGIEWLTTETMDFAAGGGFLNWHEDELTNSARTVTNVREENGKYDQTAISADPHRVSRSPLHQQREPHRELPNANLDDDSDRMSEYDSDSSDEEARFPPAMRHDSMSIRSIENYLMPRCSDKTPPLIMTPPRGRTKKFETQVFPKSSAISPGKRPRQRNSVAFAGSKTLVIKSDQTDMVLRCEFVDVVEVSYVPPASEYSQAVLETLWYTRKEIKKMKHEFFYWRQKNKKRGQLMAPSKPPRVPPKLTTAGRSHNLRHLRHRETIDTVLKEQERQRQMCQHIYGKIVDPSGTNSSCSILEPERLRDVYTRAAKTLQRQEQASERAQVCRLECDPEFHQGRENYHEVTPAKTTSTDEVRREDPRIVGEWSSKEACHSGFFLDLSSTFGTCIDGVFSIILDPFLKQRGGPLFLDVGEEILVV